MISTVITVGQPLCFRGFQPTETCKIISSLAWLGEILAAGWFALLLTSLPDNEDFILVATNEVADIFRGNRR